MRPESQILSGRSLSSAQVFKISRWNRACPDRLHKVLKMRFIIHGVGAIGGTVAVSLASASQKVIGIAR
jgi:phosphoglycerate dehydrogenase-like enzyme